MTSLQYASTLIVMTFDSKDPFPAPGSAPAPVSSRMILEPGVPDAPESVALIVDSSSLVVLSEGSTTPHEDVTVLRDVSDLLGDRSAAPRFTTEAPPKPPVVPSVRPSPSLRTSPPLPPGAGATPSYNAEVWARGVSRAPAPSSFPVPAPKVQGTGVRPPSVRAPSVPRSSLRPPVTSQVPAAPESKKTSALVIFSAIASAAAVGLAAYSLVGKTKPAEPAPVAAPAPSVQAVTQVAQASYACATVGLTETFAEPVDLTVGMKLTVAVPPTNPLVDIDIKPLQIGFTSFAQNRVAYTYTGADASWRRMAPEESPPTLRTTASVESELQGQRWKLERVGQTLISTLGTETTELDHAFALSTPILAKFGGRLYAAWSHQEESEGPWAIRSVELRQGQLSQRPWPQDSVSSMSPQMAPLAGGGALFVWAEEKGEGARVVAQAVRADGSLSGPRLVVSEAGKDAGKPQVAEVAPQEIVVAYLGAAGNDARVSVARLVCVPSHL